jgi:hypothetical protein
MSVNTSLAMPILTMQPMKQTARPHVRSGTFSLQSFKVTHKYESIK